MHILRLIAEVVGWIVIAFSAAWLSVVLTECAFVLLSKWKHFIAIGRLAIYFNGAGNFGTTTSFTTYGGERYDQLFWLVFWKRRPSNSRPAARRSE